MITKEKDPCTSLSAVDNEVEHSQESTLIFEDDEDAYGGHVQTTPMLCDQGGVSPRAATSIRRTRFTSWMCNPATTAAVYLLTAGLASIGVWHVTPTTSSLPKSSHITALINASDSGKSENAAALGQTDACNSAHLGSGGGSQQRDEKLSCLVWKCAISLEIPKIDEGCTSGDAPRIKDNRYQVPYMTSSEAGCGFEVRCCRCSEFRAHSSLLTTLGCMIHRIPCTFCVYITYHAGALARTSCRAVPTT